MEKEQFDEIREFARSLTQKRQVMADGPLLDLCQQHLNALLAVIAEEYEEAPHENAADPEPELPLPATGEDIPLRDREPEPVHREVHQHSSHQPPHHKKAPTKKHR